ncbi:MAG TPA: DUF1844 domain-containing protein [Pyrinomonadaceae bacterium]
MSEEQPTFKVRDRRLFNPDGTPRDVEREESPESAPASAAATTGEPETADLSSASATATETTPSDTAAGERATGTASATATAAAGAGGAQQDERASSPGSARDEDLYAEEEVPGADNPASFINFLMSIASNAAAALGMMEHPVTGQRGVDLPLAKHWIDVLGMLHQKTRGNLVVQEQQIFEGLLSDLRLQYVTLTTPPAQPRGFTGRDILGGK